MRAAFSGPSISTVARTPANPSWNTALGSGRKRRAHHSYGGTHDRGHLNP
ncbi:hypothetical protein [Streptomyces klenkii]